jgi:hypothetical protein
MRRFDFFACGAAWFARVASRRVVSCRGLVLAFPCVVSGLFGSPLCGAALTFFAAAPPQRK